MLSSVFVGPPKGVQAGRGLRPYFLGCIHLNWSTADANQECASECGTGVEMKSRWQSAEVTEYVGKEADFSWLGLGRSMRGHSKSETAEAKTHRPAEAAPYPRPPDCMVPMAAASVVSGSNSI